MKPYKALITKDDRLFLNHAKKHLGMDWSYVWGEAMDEYKKHARESKGKREANLIILAALKEIGQEHWRDESDKVSASHPKDSDRTSKNAGGSNERNRSAKTEATTSKSLSPSGTKAKKGESKLMQMLDEATKR